MLQVNAEGGLLAHPGRYVVLQAAQIAVVAAGTAAGQIDVEAAVVPVVAHAVLAAIALAVAAFAPVGAEHTGPPQQPGAAKPCVDDAASAFGMGLCSEAVVDAPSQGGAGNRVGVVAEGVDAIVAPQPADARRPVGQAGGQQLLGAVEGKIQRLHAAERIGDHHLRRARAVDAWLRRQLERADRHLPAVLAQAVDVQLDTGGDHRLAEEGRRRGQDTVRLQPVVSTDLDAGHARRP